MQASSYYNDNADERKDSILDKSFRDRLVNHLQQLMQAHLLKDETFLKQQKSYEI